MSACTTAVLRRLLACVLVAAVTANDGENTNQTKREVTTPFLSEVIRRIENDRQQVARPVQDLKVALDRIAEIFGPEAANVEDTPTLFELPENAETLPTSASTSPVSNIILPTAPTGTSSSPSNNVVSATLSPQDLRTLYQIAAQKGLTLDLSAMQEGILPASAGPHGVKGLPTGIAGPTPLPPSSTGSPLDQAESYYYYFVPLKNLHGLPQQQMMQALMKPPNPESEMSSANSAADAAGAAALMAGGADRAVEPLFMAMAGFVGMALMFVASVLFLPKLGALRSLRHAPDEVASIGKLVLQSIEGKDCSERLTCEIGRAARTLKLGGKPLRILELVLPPPMSFQISRIRRAVARKEKCNFIPCKFRRPPSLQFPPKKPFAKPPLKPSLFKPATLKPPLRPARDERPYRYPPPPTQPSIYGPSYPEIKSSTSPRPPATSPRPPATSPRPQWSPKPSSAPRPSTTRPPQQKKNPKASSQSREPRVRSR